MPTPTLGSSGVTFEQFGDALEAAIVLSVVVSC